MSVPEPDRLPPVGDDPWAGPLPTMSDITLSDYIHQVDTAPHPEPLELDGGGGFAQLSYQQLGDYFAMKAKIEKLEAECQSLRQLFSETLSAEGPRPDFAARLANRLRDNGLPIPEPQP